MKNDHLNYFLEEMAVIDHDLLNLKISFSENLAFKFIDYSLRIFYTNMVDKELPRLEIYFSGELTEAKNDIHSLCLTYCIFIEDGIWKDQLNVSETAYDGLGHDRFDSENEYGDISQLLSSIEGQFLLLKNSYLSLVASYGIVVNKE